MPKVLSPLILTAALSLPTVGQSAPVVSHTALLKATAANFAELSADAVAVKSEGKGKAKGHGKKKIKHKAKKKAKGNGKAKVKTKAKLENSGNATNGDTVSVRVGRLAGLGIPLATLGAAGLADVLIDCPPGLASKEVPCVPPGQARKGVTAEDWAARNDDDLRRALVERQMQLDLEHRHEFEDGHDDWSDPFSDNAEAWQVRIVDMFDLEPAPEGHAYMIIDGQPVLVDHENYMRIRSLRIMDGVEVYRPEDYDIFSMVGHDGLIDMYDLPEPEPDHYYAAVDGEVLLLPLPAYEMMQLLRIVAIAGLPDDEDRG